MKRPFLALAVALLASTAAPADTLIDNVNGIQVDADGRIDRFAAILIGEDGRIKQVWSAGPKPKGATKVIDGGGRTLLPGLIDAHGHVIESPGGSVGLGLLALQLDLTGTSSLTDLQRRLGAYAEAKPGSGWIIGRGWNQELWPDQSFPTAADLDKIVSDRPVWLVRVDGHAAVGNSAALAAGAVTSRTADPAGGKIERFANGAPTGLFIDNAIAIVDEKIPDPSRSMLDQALIAAQEILLANGITATADMGTNVASWEAYRRAGEAERLRMRFIAYADDVERMRTLVPNGPTPWLYADRLRMVGIKIYADGALGSRGAWLKKPYADKPDTRGLQFLIDDELRQRADEAASHGLQVAVHAIGDAAGEQVIRTFEWLKGRYPGERRWRIVHAQILDPSDIPRLAPAGIMASMNPVHQTSDRLMAEKRLGLDRLAGAYAWRSVLQSGAKLDFGSDFPVESPNPFPGLAAAISRQDMNGQPPGGWRPEERVSLAQALDGFTRSAAFAGFAEDRIGSLEPGKWADFIIVDRDPAMVDAQALARTQVLETWVAGRKVWEKAPSGAGAERGR